MAEEPLTKDSVLDAAEAVLRRFGLAKSNLSDVARALGVSHAAIYRYYENKAALRKAVRRTALTILNIVSVNNTVKYRMTKFKPKLFVERSDMVTIGNLHKEVICP